MKDSDFHAEMDMETIMRAEEIKANPKRLQAMKDAAAAKAERLIEFAGKSGGPAELKRGFTKL